MRFNAINLEPETGPFERALEEIARIRTDLDLDVRHVRNSTELSEALHGAPTAPDTASTDAWRRPWADWTNTFVFIDTAIALEAEIRGVLRSVAPPREGTAEGGSSYRSPAVLFHSVTFSEEGTGPSLVDACETELIGLFVYRALEDHGYGSDGEALVRLQYALEGLFSTNWTRVSARPSAPALRRRSAGGASVRAAEADDRRRSEPQPESRQRNNRLEPFDDHGPFLSVQIHDLSRIVALSELASLPEAVEAFVADHEPRLLDGLRGKDGDARFGELLVAWQSTDDYACRERRLKRILDLYGGCLPTLDDDTLACFDRMGFPAWLDKATLRVQRVTLEQAVASFLEHESLDWRRCWLRAAECYLRRLREQVIT